MAKHTAYSVTQVLKSTLRKLLTALAVPAPSRKHASKVHKTSKKARVAQATPTPAVAVASNARDSNDAQQLDQLPNEISHIKIEAKLQEPRGEDDYTDATLTARPDELSDASSVPADARQNVDFSFPILQDHTSPILQDYMPRCSNSSTDIVERTRADGVNSVDSPSIASATKKTGGDDTVTATTAGDIECPEALLAIPIESELAQQLKVAVLEHRRLNVLEQDADLQLSSLEDQAETLSRQITGLEEAIEDLKAVSKSPEQSAEIIVLYEAISNLREAEDDAWQRRQRLIRHMSELYQQFRDEQCALFDNLDSTLVSRGLVQSAAVTVPSYSNSSAITPRVRSLKPAHLLRRSAASTANQTKDASDQATADIRKRSALLDDFIAKRKALATCEERFDARYDLFDALEAARTQKLEAGKAVDTSTKCDHYIHDATRRLTRDFIDAETQYDAAKAAAVAAGIQLKFSDLESGFVDDVDDGYRVSMEMDMVQECDRGRIEDWLMDIEDKACPTQYLSVRDFAGMGEIVRVDDWLGDEVEISDSRSLVAEGPSRKRIDRWRSQL